MVVGDPATPAGEEYHPPSALGDEDKPDPGNVVVNRCRRLVLDKPLTPPLTANADETLVKWPVEGEVRGEEPPLSEATERLVTLELVEASLKPA